MAIADTKDLDCFNRRYLLVKVWDSFTCLDSTGLDSTGRVGFAIEPVTVDVKFVSEIIVS